MGSVNPITATVIINIPGSLYWPRSITKILFRYFVPRRLAEGFLDEKGFNYTGKAGYARGKIHHQWRQITPSHFPDQPG